MQRTDFIILGRGSQKCILFAQDRNAIDFREPLIRQIFVDSSNDINVYDSNNLIEFLLTSWMREGGKIPGKLNDGVYANI
jgi:hypothetical protein